MSSIDDSTMTKVDSISVAGEQTRLVDHLLDVLPSFYVAVAGLESLLGVFTSVPGSSRKYLGGCSCYSTSLLQGFCGTRESFCSEAAASALARAAFREAQGAQVDAVIGVGVSAVLATNRPHQGGERVWLAVCNGFNMYSAHYCLEASASRPGQTQAAVAWILNNLELWYHSEGELQAVVTPAVQVAALEYAKNDPIVIDENGGWQPLQSGMLNQVVVFPGSFNPVHYGHLRMAHMIQVLMRHEVVFELCCSNADPRKQQLTLEDLKQRLPMLRGARVLLSNLPLFTQKAQKYRTDFVVGADTWERIFDSKYFREGEDETVLKERFCEWGINFFVFQRPGSQLVSMPYVMPAAWDISSTELRQRGVIR